MSDEKLKKDSLDERLRKVHIPTLEELLNYGADMPYGLLFACSNEIMYASFACGSAAGNFENSYKIEKPAMKIAEVKDIVWALLSGNNEIYYGNWNCFVCSLSGKKSSKRECVIESLVFFGGRVLDAGDYGIYDSLNNKRLLTKKQMRDKNIMNIDSLFVFDEKLHAHVKYYHRKHGVVEVLEENGSFDFGRKIKHYNVYNLNLGFSQGFFLPDKRFISCANGNFLDLEGRKIEGTKVDDVENIWRVVLLHSDDGFADVTYSGAFNWIRLARIDLKSLKAETKTLIPRLSNSVSALEVIRSKEMHEKLMSIGKELK